MTRAHSFAGFAAGLFVVAHAGGQPARTPPAPAAERVTVAAARDRATLAHEVYAATLDAMHHHFFRRDQAVLPARAMEDVFADVGRRTGVSARWIAVNTPPMSVDHEAKTAFEKAAAAELAAGKGSYEKVEDGVYRRAGAIPLGGGCVGCHVKFFPMTPNKIPRVAGLVVAVPVKE